MTAFKSSSELYRTWDGQRWACWTSWPTEAELAAYKTAGVRVRRRGGDLFIHPDDEGKALAATEGLGVR